MTQAMQDKDAEILSLREQVAVSNNLQTLSPLYQLESRLGIAPLLFLC